MPTLARRPASGPDCAPTGLTYLLDILLQQAGYMIIVPALVIFEVALSVLAVRTIPFTEIDFQTYIRQANLFLGGERDYARLDPPGGSGPCVYPAGHLYLFSALSYLTQSGKDLLLAQIVFGGLMILTLLAVASLYRSAGAPPFLLVPLVLSKRLHSIFLLRMFNGPFALFLAYASFVVAQQNSWKLASVVFSLALGIKMNVLLFLPAFATALFLFTGFTGLLRGLVLIVAVQLALAAPFLQDNAASYFANSFDLSRQFEFQWTVNWRFVGEKVFLSKRFALGLLGAHLGLLIAFGLFRWTGLARERFAWLRRRWSRKADDQPLTEWQSRELLTMLFTANFIGILCSRSLHYQFYSWYFHQIPFLLWRAKLPTLLKFVLPAAIEWAWNVFPSTNESSSLLLASHLLMFGGIWIASPHRPDRLTVEYEPAAAAAEKGADAATAAVAGESDDDIEVEQIVLGSSARSSKAVKATDETTNGQKPADDGEQDAAEEGDDESNDDDGESEEEKLIKMFRRRIAIRKKVVGVLGKAMPTVRRLLIVAALALLVVIPDPHSPLSKGIYVDENALQPGQAQVYWDYFDVTYADMVAEKVDRVGRFGDVAARAELIRSELTSYGLQAHTQNYTYPVHLFAPPGEDATARSGVNVYARSPSPRIDGREAIILSASWRSRWRGENDPFPEPEDAAVPSVTEGEQRPRRINVRGIAALLVLARYLATQNFLSKDLIFVFSDGYLEGINAWSSSYFGDSGDGDGDTAFEPIQSGGSQVWNALSLDYPSDSFSKLALLYEGIDGQLPNMDSINALIMIAERVGGGVPVSLYGEVEGFQERRTSWLKPLLDRIGLGWVETTMYEDGVRAALHQMRHGATGQTTGAHGVFQRHHVDAFTLFAVPARGPYGFYHVGRLVESYVRSLSNLLERLHHSQFLYILVSPRRFVPIGVAIIVPLLVSISMTLSGLATWYKAERRSDEAKGRWKVENDVAAERDGDVELEQTTEWEVRRRVAAMWARKGEGSHAVDDSVSQWEEAGRPWKAALCVLVAAFVSGIVMLRQVKWIIESDHSIYLSLVSLLPALLLTIPVRLHTVDTRHTTSLLRTTTLLYSGMTTATLCTLNVSFATFLSLLLFTLHPSLPSWKPWRIIEIVWVNILNPFIVISFARAAGAPGTTIHTALYDAEVLQSWTVTLVGIIWYPVVVLRSVEVFLKWLE